jgi:hypothetical protein
MPELFTIEETATLLRVKETKVLDLMNHQGLKYIEGVAKGRLVLSEHLWDWVRTRSMSAEQHADESRED